MTLTTAPRPPVVVAPPVAPPVAPVADTPGSPVAITGKSGSTFLWPMLLLPRRKRRGMFAIYAFCRTIDDIVDHPGAPGPKRAALAGWRDRIHQLYQAGGTDGDPVSDGLAWTIARYGLPKAELEAVIDGMAMDLAGMMRGPTLALLELYCRRVAGAVGLLSIRVFDRAVPAAETFALKLGDALQLTNILRDLGEDARMGRLYLPREVLDDAGITASDPDAVLADPRLADACEAVAVLAERRYEEARRALGAASRRRLWAAWAMMLLYQRLLARLRARGWHDWATPVRLPRRERISVALRCALGFPPTA